MCRLQQDAERKDTGCDKSRFKQMPSNLSMSTLSNQKRQEG